MVDKTEKLLRKLSKKDFKLVMSTLHLLVKSETEGLDILKLSGKDSLFRVKKGNFRIRFKYKPDGSIDVKDIKRRSEKTYKDV